MSTEAAFEAVIGLEVHVQLDTRTKLFCACANEFGGNPNSRICEVCTGQPGALPVLGERALEQAIVAGLALHCKIREHTRFDRKNYFYPDLPKGYQISQWEEPIAENGRVEFELEPGVRRSSHVVRAHLEEDAGKVIHPEGETFSWVDYNRAGVPLLEIVTAPDLRTPSEAAALLTALRRLLRYAKVSDCDMEKGSMRCDANLSIREVGTSELGTKVEIKNLNSIRHVEQALRSESQRQSALAAAGRVEEIVQETRSFRERERITVTMRRKEGADDYRYFPDPDLPVVEVSTERREHATQQVGERPLERADRYRRDWELSAYDAAVLVDDRAVADWFEAVVAAGAGPKPAANWVQGELRAHLAESGRAVGDVPASPEQMAALIRLVESGRLSHTAAKTVFQRLANEGGDPLRIAEEADLLQIQDEDVLVRAVQTVIAREERIVADYRGGKGAALNALLGRVMRELGGKGNPGRIRELLTAELADEG